LPVSLYNVGPDIEDNLDNDNDSYLASLEEEEVQEEVIHNSPPQPLAANAQGFAAAIALSTPPMDIVFDDIQASDIESEQSVDFEQYAPPIPDLAPEDVVQVPSRHVTTPISDFILALGIWCDTELIKRRTYNSLLEVLRLLDCPETKQLPERLDTLHTWCRSRIPLPPIQKASVAVLSNKQPSKKTKARENHLEKVKSTFWQREMYYFDFRILITMLLSGNNNRLFHTGMADIVESPFEYWHSISWGSSIRTCGTDFARYPDLTPIIPSDIVQFRCNTVDCYMLHRGHCGQITFFGRDRRPQSATCGKVLLTIRPLINHREAACEPWQTKLSVVKITESELLMIEGADEIIQPNQILYRRFDISIHRSECLKKVALLYVHCIFNVDHQQIRSISLTSPIRGELEIEAYGREHIISQLSKGVKSFPVLLFIDAFGLYRNMYRSLTAIYVMPASLCISERQKSINAHTLTLGPHGSNLNDVVNSLRTGIEALDRGCILDVNGVKQPVWAPILALLGDMKQQQESAGFLSPRANRCCRFCDATIDNRGDMLRDIVKHGRYHHQVLALRAQAELESDKTKRENFLRTHGLAAQSSALQSILPALDLTLSRPPDPTHSEYFGLVRRLYPMIYKTILTQKASSEFTTIFQRFPFPPGWGRIQSPEKHMGSWSMSECGRASVIVPIIFRCWLKPSHVRKAFTTGLTAQFPAQGRPHNFSDIDLIVYGFGKLARSNSLISAIQLSFEDRRDFHQHILEARRYFLGFMKAGAATGPKSKAIARTSGPGRSQVQGRLNAHLKMKAISKASPMGGSQGQPMQDSPLASRSPSPSPSAYSMISSDIGVGEDELSKEARKELSQVGHLPNFHIGVHFEKVMQEYAVLWNVNVLFGEDKHRFYKNAVLSTNHRRPERQLLLRDAVRSTIKSVMKGVFLHTDMEITTQIKKLREKCPSLLESLLSLADRDLQAEPELEANLASIPSHIRPAVRGRLKTAFCQERSLPTKIASCTPTFRTLMQAAMAEYNLHGINWGRKPLYWYEECSYTGAESAKRHTIHIGDYVSLASGGYAQVKNIYTHCLQFDDTRRVFIYVQLLKRASYMDEVLDLGVYRQTSVEKIISLSQVCLENVYIIPVPRTLNRATSGSSRDNELDLLHCTWNIKFL
jgi:hypothetical protein